MIVPAADLSGDFFDQQNEKALNDESFAKSRDSLAEEAFFNKKIQKNGAV